MVFHWILGDSKSSQFSRTFLSSITNFNCGAIRMFSIFFLFLVHPVSFSSILGFFKYFGKRLKMASILGFFKYFGIFQVFFKYFGIFQVFWDFSSILAKGLKWQVFWDFSSILAKGLK